MMKLCFATNNIHKLEEVQSMLGNRFSLVTLKEIGCKEDIPETRDTISENSLQKAECIWDNYHVDCFADDTGLEVASLNDEPGVSSAHYAGPQRNADDNMDLLLKRLSSFTDRKAQFKTVITLVRNGEYFQFEGSVPGNIILEKRGTQGFGYDPIFIPDGFDHTFAEMTMEEKGTISHRAIAFKKLVNFLLNQ
jgi:XTP/dITP diphosphohydrolase